MRKIISTTLQNYKEVWKLEDKEEIKGKNF
jgi:hypothetical protein